MTHHNSLRSRDSSLYFMVVSALTCAVNCGTVYCTDRCYFINHVKTIALATGGLQSSCGNWKLNLECHRKRGVNTYINVKTFLKTCFHCHY